ncbi:hypothetical protein FXB41_33210 [Bradyrhizobium canariense]|uniref:hypothetical protein n=1 Tax=Bradyrhizobium canariense TaxID=255045 RepID=UPI001CA58CD9|nr:hypothetical protein [Bradyrhizobium canariense]MBW5439437.1 hypothetical protein [Bradyrhizobium canariense]
MPPPSRKALESALDEIARGDATPSEAAATVRRALAIEPPLVHRVYDALRDVTWRTLTSRSFGDELRDWFELFRHASALIGDGSAVAEKIRALADLLSQSSRFSEYQPLEEVLGRKHSKSVLKALGTAGKALKKSALKNLLGLEDANLSRVTGALQGSGLIERSSSGKEASFLLTELGERWVRKSNLHVESGSTSSDAWWLKSPFPLAVWDTDGSPVGANEAFRSLTTQNAEDLPPLSDWRLDLAKTARDERRISGNTWQVEVGEGKWLQFVQKVTADGKYCTLAEDISAEMELVRSLEHQLRIAAGAQASLQQELTDSERRLQAFRSATQEIKEGLVKVAASSNERIRNLLQNFAHSPGQARVPQELQEVGRSLDAIQYAVGNVMAPVDIVRREGLHVGWMNVGLTIRQSVNAANVMCAGEMKYKGDNILDAQSIHGPVSSMRVAMGHLILVGASHGGQLVDAGISGKKFFATLKAVRPAGQDAVTSFNLSYCKEVAERMGGSLIVQGSDSDREVLLKLNCPVDKAEARAKT